MVYRDQHSHATVFKKSLLALSIIAISTPTLAQTIPDETILDEIIVSGVRRNLENAQEIRRNSDTFVDAISADDIGSLPDRSILEAMQRLPGVSIERFQAPDDPDHFGAEGSGAVVRGMQATRSEFNGRDSFTANSGRGLNFQDVPPELMGGVDLYKNQSADMIEGGIGGTVSLRTRKPFDMDGQMIAITGDVSYGDLAEKASPTFSGLYSNRWDTPVGEFGLLLNASISQLYSESHGIQNDAFVRYDADLVGASPDITDADGKVWMPNGSNFFVKQDDRLRHGFAAAVQWASPDDTLQATAEFLRSDARLTWKENAVKYQGTYGEEASDGTITETRRSRPYPGTSFAFNDRGIFQGGYIVDGGGWRGGGSAYLPSDSEYFGQKFQADTRYKDTRTITDDMSFNLVWKPTEAWEVVGDLQFVNATTSDDDLQIANGFYALQNFDTTGSTPRLAIIEPWDGRRDTERVNNQDTYETGYPGFSDDPLGDGNYFQDPNSYWWRSAMDHYERSEGESVAGRIDVTHYLDNSDFFRAIKVGLRYADRQQIVRHTSYNWGHVGAEWGNGGGPMRLTEQEDLMNDYEYVDWSNFHRGNVVSIPGNGFLFPKESLIKDVISGRRQMPQNNPDQDGIWIPYQNRADVIPGTYFTEAEIYDTTETNTAAYVRFDFGSELFGTPYSGNLGFRYVELERVAVGSVIFPDLVAAPYPEGAPTDLTDREAIRTWAETQVGAYDPDDADSPWESEQDWFDDVIRTLAYSREPRNWLTPAERGFGNDAYELLSAKSTYSTVLPSVNLKVDLTDDWVLRFAASKAIALPDMSEVRNQAVLGAQQLVVQYADADPDADPDLEDRGRDIASVGSVIWQGSGGNPYLDPMESIQYDAAAEWYFAPGGSLTMSLFYKDLKNFFIQGAYPQTYTNPLTGVAQTVNMTTTRNGGDGKLQGFEIAYQQFYDMLPAPWDGFGIQANYTYIESEGIPNFTASADSSTDADPDDDPNPQPGLEAGNLDLSGLPLRGQSKHTANFVVMYEKHDWSARLAYNWRSEYLVTTRDVISGHPIWNDDAGFLDGSVFYNVTPEITIGLQGTNLLNTQTKTLMTLDNEERRTGRSWFVNDRRVALIVKAVF